MIRPVLALSLALLPALPFAAKAGPTVDAMANCLVMNTTGAERVMMIRWITFAFAAHPSVSTSVQIDASQIEPTDREVAALFTALLTERCPNETRAAYQAEGQAAIEGAFNVLGTVASSELMMAPEVSGAMTGFTAYIDETALNAVLQ